jgi:hypothetical protein
MAGVIFGPVPDPAMRHSLYYALWVNAYMSTDQETYRVGKWTCNYFY